MSSNYSDAETWGDILIVGEIPLSLNFVLPLLTERGYTVHSTSDSEKALEISKSSSIDLIILSTALQNPSAYTLCERLKLTTAGSSKPILFLSGFDPSFQAAKVFQAGGADYLLYPAAAEEILARIENQLAIAKLRGKLDHQSHQLQHTLQELQKLEDSMHQVYDELRQFSFLDSLTRVANRRRFEEYLDKEWRRCVRERVARKEDYQTALSLILCDLDCFKYYNDLYGIAAGDECLKQIARVLEEAIKRPADLVARYGGESFAILLPNTNYEGALMVANLMRSEVRSLQLPHPNSSVSPFVTLSYGVVTIIPSQALSPETLSRAAQMALQRAKAAGRDQIISEQLGMA
jgi:diguanylate cyclase (GGDEF)-like protein